MPQYDQTVVESYRDQLQIYQDKITAQTISQPEIDSAIALSTEYYNYLNDVGIEYGTVASEVIQRSTVYGELANQILLDAMRLNPFGRQQEQIDSIMPQISISLAASDSDLRATSAIGALSSRQIADYHYNVFETNNLPRSAWGGAFFEEFVGPGSWMEIRDNIAFIAQSIEIGIDGFSSSDVVNGVSIASASNKIVSAAMPVIISNPGGTLSELANLLYQTLSNQLSLIIPTESGENLLTARDGSNLLVGSNGQSNIYHFPRLNGQNVVNDPNGMGRVIIGDGNNAIELRGNAIPKKNAAGNIIPNQWTLNGYDLIRSGDNLIVVEDGTDVSSPDTPMITIPNFPFDSGLARFGITFGQELVNPFGGIYGSQFFPSDTVGIIGGPFLFPQVDFGSFPNSFPAKSLYSLERGSTSRFFAAARLAPSDPSSRHVIKEFDSSGNLLRVIDVGAQFFQKIDYISADTESLIPYTTSSGALGLARFNPSSGQVVANRIFASPNSDSISLFGGGAVGYLSNGFYFRYFHRYTDANGNSVSEFVVQQFDPNSFADIGDPQIYFSGQAVVNNSGGSSSVGFPISISSYYLGNGNVLSLTMQGNPPQPTVAVSPGKLQEISPAELPNYLSIAPGEQVSTDNLFSANGNIVSLQDNDNPQNPATFVVQPGTNGRSLIIGSGLENDNIDLSNFNLDNQGLAAITHEVDVSQSSIEKLLREGYIPSSSQSVGKSSGNKFRTLRKRLTRGEAAELQQMLDEATAEDIFDDVRDYLSQEDEEEQKEFSLQQIQTTGNAYEDELTQFQIEQATEIAQGNSSFKVTAVLLPNGPQLFFICPREEFLAGNITRILGVTDFPNRPIPTIEPTPEPTETPAPTSLPTPAPEPTPLPTPAPTPFPTFAPFPTPVPTALPSPNGNNNVALSTKEIGGILAGILALLLLVPSVRRGIRYFQRRNKERHDQRQNAVEMAQQAITEENALKDQDNSHRPSMEVLPKNPQEGQILKEDSDNEDDYLTVHQVQTTSPNNISNESPSTNIKTRKRGEQEETVIKLADGKINAASV